LPRRDGNDPDRGFRVCPRVADGDAFAIRGPRRFEDVREGTRRFTGRAKVGPEPPLLTSAWPEDVDLDGVAVASEVRERSAVARPRGITLAVGNQRNDHVAAAAVDVRAADFPAGAGPPRDPCVARGASAGDGARRQNAEANRGDTERVN